VTIREELAKTLKAAFWRTTSHKPTEDFNDHWYRTADECLRQMEWARRQTAESCEEKPYAFHNLEQPITLAPPDWKP